MLKGTNCNNVSLFVLADAMAHCIFDEWLQNKSRDRTVEHTGIDLKVESKPIPKTALLNADVLLQKIHFRGEWNFVRVHFIQGYAEQFTQAEENVFRPFGVFVNERRSRLKRVEQKMGMKLRSQVFDLSLSEARFELSSAKIAFPSLIVDAVEMHHGDNQPIGHETNLGVLSEVMRQHRGG